MPNQSRTAAIAPYVPYGRQDAVALPEADRPTSKFTLRLLALYVFLIVSRLLDLSPIWWMRIPLILLMLLIVLTLARGELGFAFSSPVTRALGAFTVWVVVCFPFSVWRSASMDSVRMAVESFVFFLIVVQLVRTVEDWRALATALAFAVLAAASYGFFLARDVDGRLSIVGGTLADPNEYALTLLAGVPFWWLKASRATGPRKLLYLACAVPAFITCARTGSRAGLLALATMMLVTFFFAKGGQKMVICAVTLVGLVAALIFLPPYLKARYLSMFSPHGVEQLDEHSRERLLGADLDSSDMRQVLLWQSIHMTFEHPLFGVGPGVFSFAAWDERKANEGQGGIILVTHNTYTQVSSETGFIGFILFAIGTILCIKSTASDYRQARYTDPEVANCSRYLLSAWLAFAVGIFFLSLAYTNLVAVFFALAVSLHNVVTARAKHPPASANQAIGAPAPLKQPINVRREPRRPPRLSRRDREARRLT